MHEMLGGTTPTVLWTGNGYHVIVLGDIFGRIGLNSELPAQVQFKIGINSVLYELQMGQPIT